MTKSNMPVASGELKVGASVDPEIKALAVRVIDVHCTWLDADHDRVVDGDGCAAVIDRMHVAVGDCDVDAIRQWLDDKQFRHGVFQRVLVDPAHGSRTKVDTIIKFERETDAMLFKLTF